MSDSRSQLIVSLYKKLQHVWNPLLWAQTAENQIDIGGKKISTHIILDSPVQGLVDKNVTFLHQHLMEY